MYILTVVILGERTMSDFLLLLSVIFCIFLLNTYYFYKLLTSVILKKNLDLLKMYPERYAAAVSGVCPKTPGE